MKRLTEKDLKDLENDFNKMIKNNKIEAVAFYKQGALMRVKLIKNENKDLFLFLGFDDEIDLNQQIEFLKKLVHKNNPNAFIDMFLD